MYCSLLSLGLGLAIVKHIIEAHKEQIFIESQASSQIWDHANKPTITLVLATNK